MNSVNLIGRLTKDCDLRYTQSGKAVASFTLAVDKYSKGEKSADFINCVVWDKAAEALANYTSKGSRIGVKGSINTRNYENQQGQRVYVTEVVADPFNGIEFLDTKKDSQQSTERNQRQSQKSQQYNQLPIDGLDQRGFNTEADPFSRSSQVNISDSDLPF